MAEWRYLHERARVKHALTRSTDRYSVCGTGPGLHASSTDWRGTGSQHEYERNAALPECKRCNRILKESK